MISEVCLRKSHCISKNFANFAGKHLCRSLFLIKLQTFSALQTFSFEICKVFKNTYLEEYLRTTDCFSDLKHGISVFHNSMFFFVSKQLPPKKMVLPDNCPVDDCPPDDCPPDNCFRIIEVLLLWSIVVSSCFPSLWFKLVLDFEWFLYKKKLYKHSETEIAWKKDQVKNKLSME